MLHKLNTITSDCRLDRIFGIHGKPCAIELWVLQLKWSFRAETRILYGRVIPSNYCNDQWSAPREDSFKHIDDDLMAQVVRVSLFCTSEVAKKLADAFVSGLNLNLASSQLGVKLPTELIDRFGCVQLAGPFGFRPVMHLPTRDYYRFVTNRLSPTSFTSADSAAITSLVKLELFVINGQLEAALAAFAINELSSDTGMDFLELDAWRLGDIELLVLPGQDDNERQLVNIKNKKDSSTLDVEILGPLASTESELHIRVLFLNDNSIFHMETANVPPGATFPMTVTLSIPSFGMDILDAYEVEINAKEASVGIWKTCLRWGGYLVREINQQMHMIGSIARVENDWLKKRLGQNIKPASKAFNRSRVKRMFQLRWLVGVKKIHGFR